MNKARRTKVWRRLAGRLAPVWPRVEYALRGLSYFARLRLRGGARPRVTGVVVGRNDDYMPDFTGRLYATLEWNLRHLLDEVVFVEWNPPAERELLSPGLAKKFESLRAYVVPHEIHREVCGSPHFQLMEYHAKNVGIRRARSPWIIATNADAAFGLDTVYNLRRRSLTEDTICIALRVDVNWRESQQQKFGLFDCLRYRRRYKAENLFLGTGEFLMASRRLWERARGYDEALVKHRLACDLRGTAQLLAHGAKLESAGLVYHLDHANSFSAGRAPHHGEEASYKEGLPYQNGEAWGLGDCAEVRLAERVWRLER